MDLFFLVYLHNYCCVPIYEILILLLLGLNKKNNIHIIISSQKEAMLSCSLALCFGSCFVCSKTQNIKVVLNPERLIA